MTREKAISLVDQKVQSLCGLSVMDLRSSLIDHDGFSSDIKVRKAK